MKTKGTVVVSILIFCMLVFFGTLFAGEGRKEEEAITLRMLLMSQAGYSEQDCRDISDEFMEKNPNIIVDQTYVAYESLHDKIITSFAGGDPYDIVLVDTPWPAEFASAGFLLDITDRVTDEMRQDIWPAAFKAGTFKGRIYAMPWLNDVEYFFYNERILKEAGISEPPRTWSEVIEQCKIIKDKGILEHPYVETWAQTEELTAQFTFYVHSFGGDFVDDDLNPLINQPEALRALNWMIDNRNKGYINPNSIENHYDDVRNIVSQGNAAFCTNWVYVWGLFNDPNESKVVGEMRITTIPGQVMKSATTNGGMNLGISSKCKHPDAAWQLVEYMSSKDVQARYAQNALPVWMSLFEDPRVIKAQPDLVDVSKEQYKYIVNRPIVPWYEEYSRTIQLEVQNALIGKKTAQEALDAIADKVIELKKEFGG
jgi:multiple sugar transport system substrate-binding protein